MIKFVRIIGDKREAEKLQLFSALIFLWSLFLGQCKLLPKYSFAKPTVVSDKSEFAVGTTWKYKCLPGYFRKSFTITCLETSKWSDAQQFCKHEYFRQPYLVLSLYLCRTVCHFPDKRPVNQCVMAYIPICFL